MGIQLFAVLFVFLMVAVFFDVKEFRIPNWLILIGVATGIAANFFFEGTGINGALIAIGGMGLGLLVFLFFYLIKIMGAGAAKLMALVGAFLGYHEEIDVTPFILICGGILALLYAFCLNEIKQIKRNVFNILEDITKFKVSRKESQLSKFPYSIAIAGGVLIYYITKS